MNFGKQSEIDFIITKKRFQYTAILWPKFHFVLFFKSRVHLGIIIVPNIFWDFLEHLFFWWTL